MDSKIRALGVEMDANRAKAMTTFRLQKITSEVEKAPELLQNIGKNYICLQKYDRGVLAIHFAKLKQYILFGLSGHKAHRGAMTPYGLAWSLVRRVSAYRGVGPVEWLVENVDMIIAALNAEFDHPGTTSRTGNGADQAMLCFSALPLEVACVNLPRILHALNQDRDGLLLWHLLQFLDKDVPKSTLDANRDTLLQLLPPLCHYRGDNVHGYNAEICKMAGSLAARVAN